MPQSLMEQIRRSVIGARHEIDGPFGQRMVTYADYTASGRSLSFIEEFIRDHVMPYYANTHTESSWTGLQTGRFREDARDIIRRATGCTDDDVVIFCGSGATGAINKLIGVLNLRIPRELDDRFGLSKQIPDAERPVVFIGPYEHHSNELPWRESIADVVVIEEQEDGRPNPAALVRELECFADRPLKIGSFSAASNVTGIGADVRQLSSILHQHGALAFWDYAAAAPYVELDMSCTEEDPNDYKDAMFISPHKLIGGPGSPGVLVAKRALFKNQVPTVPGGGTVAYVSTEEHRYLDDPEEREEGGTPDIIGAVRAGLAFQLKEQVGAATIREAEEGFIRRAVERWLQNPNLVILGKTDAWRLSIVSFLVRHHNRYLHHNFVVRLLNDLFGIQVRGGCSCAGPYGHRLLHIDGERSRAFREEIERGCEGTKPGWARVNFNYFMAEEEFAYILDAVDFVGEHGWKFLPLYSFVADTGLWHHREVAQARRMSLDEIRYVGGSMLFPHRHSEAAGGCYHDYLAHARRILDDLDLHDTDTQASEDAGEAFTSLRWFVLPEDVT